MFWPALDEVFGKFVRSPRRPWYGVSVDYVAGDFSVMDVELRLLAGRSYCCGELGCHVPWGCERLVRLAGERGIGLPSDVMVRWRCVVEAGARLQCHNALGLSAESEGYAFEEITGGPAAVRPVAEGVARRMPAGFTGVWVVEEAHSRREMAYVNGVAHGYFRFLNGKGVCFQEGFNKQGRRDGELITRNSEGKVLDVSFFKEGTGIYRIFNVRGMMTDEVPMREGKAHGVAKRWVGGRLVEMRHYVEGVCEVVNFEG